MAINVNQEIETQGPIHCILNFVLLAVVEKYDYVFPENGLVAYKDGKLLCKQVGLQVSKLLCTTSEMFSKKVSDIECLQGVISERRVVMNLHPVLFTFWILNHVTSTHSKLLTKFL